MISTLWLKKKKINFLPPVQGLTWKANCPEKSYMPHECMRLRVLRTASALSTRSPVIGQIPPFASVAAMTLPDSQVTSMEHSWSLREKKKILNTHRIGLYCSYCIILTLQISFAMWKLVREIFCSIVVLVFNPSLSWSAGRQLCQFLDAEKIVCKDC